MMTFENLDEIIRQHEIDESSAEADQLREDEEGEYEVDQVEDFDPENIYNIPSIRQSIETDRMLRR